MATPSEKLASSLALLQRLQKGGRRVFRSAELTRIHRERLLKHGFLQPVIRGWLISSAPDTSPGDSTPWYACFWEFCARYCADRFGGQWHLSPELSILLHAEATAIPRQLIVYSPHGTNNRIELLFGTSIYDLKTAMPPARDITELAGLRLYNAPAALVKVPESFFARHPIEAQVALASIHDASEVLSPLLEDGRSAAAGRLAGALRRMGREEIADEVVGAMKAADYDVREADPFEADRPLESLPLQVAPMARRVRALWRSLRSTAIEVFPPVPGRPDSNETYLAFVEEIYTSDAYHSLSIEGYKVSPELVERVRAADWDPERNASDRERRDALAARGYWQAFQLVKEALVEILSGTNPGTVVRTAHREWYRELFQPFVAVGLLPPPALAGYRNVPVYIKRSRHVPPRAEALRDAMPALFDLLEDEDQPAARAVLGHWMIGYLHPYQDGNGRIARFLMNAMLASGGYPWTVIRVEDRDPYLAALETASVEGDIRPFSLFLAERVDWSMALRHREGPRGR